LFKTLKTHNTSSCYFHFNISKSEQAACEAARYAPAPVRRTLQPSSSPYTPYACGARRALRHEYSWSTGSGSIWLWLWCRPYKLCSDLNSQPKRPCDLDLWPFDLESGVRVTCDVGYLCANFSLPRPLCSPVRPDVRDRQNTSDVRQKHRLITPPIRGMITSGDIVRQQPRKRQAYILVEPTVNPVL